MLNKLHEIKNERRIETCKVEARLLAYKNAQEMKGNQFKIEYDDNDESIRIILDKECIKENGGIKNVWRLHGLLLL